jgi:hypothetical protein
MVVPPPPPPRPRGTTASGPASPITAKVGLETMPPSAMSGMPMLAAAAIPSDVMELAMPEIPMPPLDERFVVKAPPIAALKSAIIGRMFWAAVLASAAATSITSLAWLYSPRWIDPITLARWICSFCITAAWTRALATAFSMAVRSEISKFIWKSSSFIFPERASEIREDVPWMAEAANFM